MSMIVGSTRLLGGAASSLAASAGLRSVARAAERFASSGGAGKMAAAAGGEKKSAAQRMQKFRVFRYDPESGVQPKMQEFSLDLNETGPMILDAVIKIKSDQDSTLAFRRSCREGVCGSCAMNVSGINKLACTAYIEPSEEAIEIQPLPSLYVIRDLVADLNNFYKQYAEVRPWLQRKTPKVVGEKENLQSQDDRAKLDGLYECILCACCSTSCPSFWWNPEQYLGPAALLQSYRWIIDSRDEYQEERLASVNDTMKLYRCHGILNCVDACPKGLNPAKAIQGIKDLVEEKYTDEWETLKAEQVRKRGDEAMAAEMAEKM